MAAGMDPRLNKLLEYTTSIGGESSSADNVRNDGDDSDASAPERALSSDFAAMSTEERSKMIDHILGKEQSDAETMKQSTDTFLNPGSTDDERDEALDKMLFLMDSIDNSMDIGKTGVLTKLMAGLANPNDEVRMGAAWVMGVALKDNPPLCAEWLQQEGHKGIITALRTEPAENDENRSKYMTVLSATLETSPALQKAFERERGYSLLTAPVAAQSRAKSIAKIMFILSKLIRAEAHGAVEAVKEPSVLQGAAAFVSTEPNDGRAAMQRVEMALRLLRALDQSPAFLDGDDIVSSAVAGCRRWVNAASDPDLWEEVSHLLKEFD